MGDEACCRVVSSEVLDGGRMPSLNTSEETSDVILRPRDDFDMTGERRRRKQKIDSEIPLQPWLG